MEQEKIGKFILKLRKEKNMTQMDLAEKIGVTDRAISKWENGRGMPDLSLLKPLCKELDITINDLLSGEKIDEKYYKEKLEENILNTIDYTDKKIKNNNKIVLIIIVLFMITFITLFLIDINRMKNNKPVLFSTWGFKYSPPISLEYEKIKNVIKEYLVQLGDNEPKHHNNEKTFVSMKIYLIEENKNTYNVYAWVLSEKYYLDNNIKQDSGYSIPHKFVLKNINNKYIIVNSIIPRDGSYYIDDMKNIFPKSVRDDMNEVYNDGTIDRLQLDIEQQIKLYFHK